MQFEFIFRFAVNCVNPYETVLCLLLLFIIFLHFVFSLFLIGQLNTLKRLISCKVQIFIEKSSISKHYKYFLFISEYKVILIVNNCMNALHGRQ